MAKATYFEIAGEPVAKGSRVAFKNGGSRESSKRVAPWMEHAVALLSKHEHIAGAVKLDVWFVHPRPKKPKYAHPSRSDLDKQVRAICDALTQANVIDDDRHVVSLHAQKRYGPRPMTYGWVSACV